MVVFSADRHDVVQLRVGQVWYAEAGSVLVQGVILIGETGILSSEEMLAYGCYDGKTNEDCWAHSFTYSSMTQKITSLLNMPI